jgi:branched-chain amino acid transport system ATP-binding protein
VSRPALACEGVTKRFGSLVAVDGVDLAVEPGARHALIGPNGAGKSTLFNVVAGTVRASAGRVLLGGRDVTARGDAWRARAGVAKTFQHSSLFGSLTVADNVAIAAQRLTGDGMRLWRPARRCRDVDRTVGEQLERTGLAGRAAHPVRELSHGERRQLELAVALATRPRLLLLDEPTAGMSLAESTRFAELVETLPRELTILLIEHDLDVVFRLADRVTVLHLGRILAEGDPAAVRSDPRVQEAYLGTRATEDLFTGGGS